MSDVTQILEAIGRGDRLATRELLPLVYDQLRALAAERLSHEQPGQTLQATALVHEAYLRLTGESCDDSSDIIGPRFANRAHFFAAAAESMRRILIEVARRKKRRAELRALNPPVMEFQPDATPDRLDLIALDEALTELAQVDQRKAKLVELRFFAGLSDREAADCLGISVRTAERDWVFTKAWLHQRLAAGR